MIEVIIGSLFFAFVGISAIYLAVDKLAAEKRRYKSEIAILKQDNNALVKECNRLQAQNQFLKNELENKE